MNVTFLRAMVISLAASAVCLASAQAQVIDQQDANLGDPLLYSQFWSAQSFKPTADNVAGAGIFLQGFNDNVVTSTKLRMELWSALPELGALLSGSATRLASGSKAFNVYGSGTASGQWVDVFWSAVAVTPATQYFLVYITDDQEFHIADTYDPMSDGTGYASGGFFTNYDYSRNSPYSNYSSSYDVNFREYATASVVTPEPASLVLLGSGLIGILGVLPRKRVA